MGMDQEFWEEENGNNVTEDGGGLADGVSGPNVRSSFMKCTQIHCSFCWFVWEASSYLEVPPGSPYPLVKAWIS